ncbi:MAG TPA: hypothetical protein DCP38_14415 [Acidobacteria bacterium]|jgi:hypothetical protein|nr:hypothetical protein [Acidobacteriota bacterium]MDP6371858.1 zf-HC2 domain-containing protein [Vicinamibacterales bacterium]HAK56658.1 hypothetical protein [Acidobacteriota bacterium]|tara:strand:+ start:2368 stop:3165 length:798 start_codon:yes stop_codon:yes gene_type:complete
MARMTCRRVRRMLGDFHDGELSVGRQIAVEAHLHHCPSCQRALTGVAAIGQSVRDGSIGRDVTPEELAGLAGAVVSRFKAEEAQTLGSRMNRMFDDMHLVWAGLAGTVALLCCVAAIFGLLSLSASGRDDSLSGVMRAMAVAVEPPAARPFDWRVRSARVSPDDALLMVLGQTSTSGREFAVTLSGVVTREGRIADLEVLLSDDRDLDVLLQVLSAAPAAHFEPARVAGAPFSSSVIWLLTHTTVRAPGRVGPEAALRLPRPHQT